MKPAGIYIHIPFCRSRCSYCDFATGMYDADSPSVTFEALVKEIESFRRDEFEAADRVDTIYFGGGTPSLLSAAQLETLLSAFSERFTVSPAPK